MESVTKLPAGTLTSLKIESLKRADQLQGNQDLLEKGQMTTDKYQSPQSINSEDFSRGKKTSVKNSLLPKSIERSTALSTSEFLRLNPRDVVTGKSLAALMKLSLGLGYPYIFAISEVNDGARKNKNFIDGVEVVDAVLNHEAYESAHAFNISTDAGAIPVPSIEMYCIKSLSEGPKKLGRIIDFKSMGYTDAMLHAFLGGIESLDNLREGSIVKVFAACCFLVGEMVPVDVNYAKSLVENLTQETIDAAVGEAMSMVVTSGLTHLVQPLLSLGGNANRPAQEDKFTPLMLAVYGRDVAMVNELVAAGADPFFEFYGLSAAQIAKEQGMDELF